ncbi:hypothetical protein AC1031_022137 [Aphanomyces cochlioides]|nr:hypothetical protein AC1031_022137 [Aphanomyces cochlioides]
MAFAANFSLEFEHAHPSIDASTEYLLDVFETMLRLKCHLTPWAASISRQAGKDCTRSHGTINGCSCPKNCPTAMTDATKQDLDKVLPKLLEKSVQALADDGKHPIEMVLQ